MRRTLAALIVALLVLVAALHGVAWLPIRDARNAWRNGEVSRAVATAHRWSRMPVWRDQYHQLLALSLLSAGNSRGAEPHLAALSRSRVWISAVRKPEVAGRLFAAGRYAEYAAYDRAVREGFESKSSPLYRAAAFTATGRLDDAARLLAGFDASVEAGRRRAVQHAIDLKRRNVFPSFVDRRGGTIESLFDGVAKRLQIRDTIETTLDPDVQHAAESALSGFRGSLIAIDPRTNEILAIATAQQAPLKEAFETFYEPGSVIKILTGINAVQSRLNLDELFPYECTGHLAVDGRKFGDWLAGGHGTLATFDDAFAQSCNVVFADLGIRLGVDRLKAFMTAAGFDGRVPLGLFDVPLGRTVGPIYNKFETGFYAIGLEHATVNTLHLAMLASMVANRGELATPRLFSGRRTLLGDLDEIAPSGKARRIAAPGAVGAIARGMRAVVTHPRGSGRRARIEGLPIAMKTGTAGGEGDRYNALVVAFAPADAPKIAFGIIAEGAGPAEHAGAQIAQEFLLGIRKRLE